MATIVTSITDLDPNGSYTYADYLTWQFTDWVELIRGKIMRRMSGPSDPHQDAVGEFHFLIRSHLKRQRCKVRVAPYDVRLTRRGADADATRIQTVVQPDVCVICDPAKIEHRGCLGAPDWIIEVTSPGTAVRDWKTKYDLYEENGVGEYWIVAPQEQAITVFVLDPIADRYQLVGEYAQPGAVPCHTLPGLAVDWADIFSEPVAGA